MEPLSDKTMIAKLSMFLSGIILTTVSAFAQDDLLKELNESEPKAKEYISATFKGTRLINFHTAETLTQGSLDFRISHRFGEVGSGSANLWGIDGPATLRLGLDYSLTDHLVIGIGRSSYQKYFDGFLKYKLVRQGIDGPKVSVVALGSVNVITDSDPTKELTGFDRYSHFYSRLAYLAQLLVARKFNARLSMQVVPSYIHYNMVTRSNDKNDVAALALMGRYKFTGSLALTAEYSATLTHYAPDDDQYKNVFSIGIDIETGGHVFQVFFTNAAAINEVQFIPFTSSSWGDQGCRLGFNISRIFEFKNHMQE